VNRGPLISILTACRNAAAHLGDLLESLDAQSFRDFEHVVIDGASTDGTVDLLRRCARPNTVWRSEPDDGISDAFNKAVLASSGRLILFMGADDRLAGPSVLGDVASALPRFREPYFFYGDVEYEYGAHVRRVARNYSALRFRWFSCIPHQAMFLDRWFFDRFGLFDLTYRRAMDYEHTARFIKRHRPQYLPLVVSVMRREGVSSDPMPTHREMDRARREHRLCTSLEIRTTPWMLGIKSLVDRVKGKPW